jgi:hypothetical protein
MQPDNQKIFPDEKGTETLEPGIVYIIAKNVIRHINGGLSERLKELVSKTSVPQGI